MVRGPLKVRSYLPGGLIERLKNMQTENIANLKMSFISMTRKQQGGKMKHIIWRYSLIIYKFIYRAA